MSENIVVAGIYSDAVLNAEEFLRELQRRRSDHGWSTACECDSCIAQGLADAIGRVRHDTNQQYVAAGCRHYAPGYRLCGTCHPETTDPTLPAAVTR